MKRLNAYRLRVGSSVNRASNNSMQRTALRAAADAERYRVIRLWQMHAEEILATEPVAPLVLVGQTQISNLSDPVSGDHPSAPRHRFRSA